MVRAPSVDKNGLKKGAWSEEEDNKLRAYILRYGHWNWRQLPKFAGLSRCGKSCRLRWLNYLKPGIKIGKFSKDEDEMVIELHKQLGNKWSAIAAKLPGRSDNEIKNHWHTHLKKRSQTKQDRPNIIGPTETYHQYGPSDQVDQKAKIAEDKITVYDDSSEESSCLSYNNSSSSDMMMTSSQSFEETFDCYFWDDLLLAEPSYSSSEFEGGFMVKEEFTLPYSLFGEDDFNLIS